MGQIESFQKEIARLNKIIEQKDAAIVRPTLVGEVLKFLHKERYDITDNPAIQATRIDMLIERMEDENTKIRVENGKILILDASGNPKENETGTRELTLDELMESKAKRIFEKVASDNRQSPGNNATTKINTYDVSSHITLEEHIAELNRETDPAKQREIRERFNKSRPENLSEKFRLETTKDYFRALNSTTDPAEQRALKEQFDRSMSQHVTQTNN